MAVVLGVLICGGNYLAWQVFHLQSMIGGSLPVLVFATVVVVALGVNPLLRTIGSRGDSAGSRGFSAAELAVIVALAGVACGYSGATYLRYLGPAAVLPAHQALTQTQWQATKALSYVPGHVGFLAEGHILDARGLAARVTEERDDDDAAGRLWRLSSAADRERWLAARDTPGAGDRAALAAAINRVLADPAFADGREAGAVGDADRVAVGRRWLQETLGEWIAPPHSGGGVLLNDGVYEPGVHDDVLLGRGHGAMPWPGDIRWSAWWPVVRLWGGLMALLVVTVILLSVVVRPQWADHERIAFPIVRLVEMLAAREPGAGLPTVARSKLFWVGFGVVGLHLINGLNAWWPALPRVPMTFDFLPVRDLFPSIRSWHSTHVFLPTVHLAVAAFAFMLPRSVSFTLGITNVVFVIAAAQMVALGISGTGGQAGTPWFELLNFGGMVGMVLAMLYLGRRYYAAVALRSVGLTRWSPAPRGAVWALRGVLVLVPLTVWHLTSSGLSPVLSALAVAMVLMLWAVSARIVCETGLLRLGQALLPMSVASAFLGEAAIGPTQMVVLTMVSIILANDLGETPMIYALTGLEATHRTGARGRGVTPGMIGMALAGLAIAVVATLAVHYRFGLLSLTDTAVNWRAAMGVDGAADVAAELAGTDALVASVNARGLERLALVRADAWSLGWAGTGLALFMACAALRLRVPWWPVHPVMFVLLANWGTATFGVSFLLGCAVKVLVMHLGGARAYHAAMPLMCGVIAGSLVSAIGWMLVGVVYFAITGHAPVAYALF